ASDGEGLRALRDAARDQDLRCDPALIAAGAPLRFRSEAAPPGLVEPRAALACSLAIERTAGEGPPDLALDLLDAMARFVDARAWDRWTNSDPIVADVTVSSAPVQRHEGCVMGAGGEEFGLALYHGDGALRRVEALIDAGRSAEVMNIPALA